MLLYAGNPAKKGLDLAVEAWALAARSEPDRRLVVTGIERQVARWYLERLGVREPPGIEWRGRMTAEDHRTLTRRADVLLSASRFEDYGIVQLEALADGALLVTTPAPGPYLALPIARELDPRLVAAGSSPGELAAALQNAFAMPENERQRYRSRARERLRVFTREALRERIRCDVLPALLDERARHGRRLR